ncbi:MAG: hypothetical protein OXE96_01115 [Gemmatimonadetes bacterium]|nr:hypothetical protein [Gemmatimonadota bacterium]
MKMAMISLMVLGAAAAGLSAYADDGQTPSPGVQEQRQAQASADADKLYDLVKRARADLREMRVAAGLGNYAPGPQVSQREQRYASVEGAGEHGGREGRGEVGEHGGRERGASAREGEEGSAYLPKMTKQNEVFGNGARLVLQFNPKTQVFAGSVTNTTARTLSQVRVEIHLDNGTELGPTKRIDVRPGQTVPVELGAFGNAFSAWVSHPEAGIEQGHGAGGEEGGEGAGEHGGGAEGAEGAEGAGEHGGGAEGAEGTGEYGGGEGSRPSGAAYKPVHNQLQILRGEMRAFEADLRGRSG